MEKFDQTNPILLVDDDKPTNFIHLRVIKNAGININTQPFTSAVDALDYLTGSGKYEGVALPQPGIIFLDINMPAMDGWEFLEEYKSISDERKAKIVVIMLTTSLNPGDVERANKYNDVITFLNKPLTVEKVIELTNKYYS